MSISMIIMIVFACIIIDFGIWFAYAKMKEDTLQESLSNEHMFNVGD